MLQPNNIKSAAGAKHRVKIVGRGNASGHGTSSTRGGKGQTARSGGSRGLITKAFKVQMQSVPKLRGFTAPGMKVAEVYLSDLEKHFNTGETVDLNSLKEKNIINDTIKAVKLVVKGDLTKKLTLVGFKASAGAKAKVAAVGGEIK